MPRLLVTLCTYNERENLELLVPEIHAVAPEAHVLVVDDNSPDGTGQYAQELVTDDDRVHVLHREAKLGLGTAIVAGLKYGIAEGYEFVLNMDADFSHHPRYIPDLVGCMDNADVGIGSRYITGGAAVGWGLKRHFMSRAINAYARLLLGLRTRDNSGAFRCYRASKVAELDFGRIVARGYAFQEEILYRCRRIGCRFRETPIVFEDRRFGTTKINWRESVAALWVIFRLGIENVIRVPVTTDAPLPRTAPTVD